MPKTRTYRSRPTRLTVRFRRSQQAAIAALALTNGVSFEAQVLALVNSQLR